MKINITRSQVAQLYVELTSDNMKEVFVVEGDEVTEEAPVTPEPAAETPTETPVEATPDPVPSTDDATPPATDTETASA